MNLKLMSEDSDLNYKVKRGQRMIVCISDGCHMNEVFEDTIHSDMIIESGITFADGGLFEPISGIGCFLGTKHTVEKFKQHNGM